MAVGNRGGRPAKPTALHVLHGTYQPVRHAKRVEPQTTSKLPPPPKHLDAGAKRRYRAVGEYLIKQGVLTEGDMGILALYAESWSNWVAASLESQREHAEQEAIEKRWSSLPKLDEASEALAARIQRVERRALGESPAVKRSREERLLVDRFGGQLGLSPVMRTKVRIDAPPKEVDKMEALLSNG